MSSLIVSIIMPYYKKDEYIYVTVESILKQTFQNFEIIIVDDERTNQSSKIMKKLKDKDNRIIIIENERNLGAGLSRNRAVGLSKGDYLAFCDCDDVWDKRKLETQLKFMKDKKVDFSHTSYHIINKKGEVVGARIADKEIRFIDLVKSCDIGLSTVMMKKNLFSNLELNFPNLKTKEDYVLWLKLSQKGVRMLGLDNKLTNWRKLNNSLSSSSLQKIIDGYRVYRTYMKYGFIKSLISLFILSKNFLKKNKIK